MPRPLWCHAFAAAVAVSLAVHAKSAKAQAASDFYKDNTITLLIGIGVGGGTDTWGRTVGRYIGSHIPGNPSVVPENMPGAAGLKMTDYLYNAASRDGLTIGLPNAGILLEPLLGGSGTSFDPMKLNYIGSPSRDTTVCVARNDAPVQTLDDLRTKELLVGASGSGGNTNIYPLFLAKALGMKFRIVQGYKGTADILLAVERGEVMGMCSDYGPLTHQSLFRDGKLRILLQVAVDKDSRIDAPLPGAFVATGTQRQALAFFVSRDKIGWPFIAPPEVPKDRIATLQRAFDATMTDPAFLADTAKLHFDVAATTGEQLAALVDRIYRTPKDVVQFTAAALGGN
jgi:tripartite-type tricarboxylate transporter receptor subunit TctC